MTLSDDGGRWLARNVIADGAEYGLSLVEIFRDMDRWYINITPFSHETHSTVYHTGTIKITTNGDKEKKPTVQFI